MKTYRKGTAARAGYASCHVCGRLDDAWQQRCSLCAAPLHVRRPASVQRTLAWLLTAVVLFIPANLLPIMETEKLGQLSANTIAGGVLLLWHHGSYPIAAIIFVASMVVPMAKMLSIGWLCFVVVRRRACVPEQPSLIYDLTELVGKWSMVDVFVVALLVALVQVGGLLSIRPGPAALAFAGVVVFTMLAARDFDSRLIWDREATS